MSAVVFQTAHKRLTPGELRPIMSTPHFLKAAGVRQAGSLRVSTKPSLSWAAHERCQTCSQALHAVAFQYNWNWAVVVSHVADIGLAFSCLGTGTWKWWCGVYRAERKKMMGYRIHCVQLIEGKNIIFTILRFKTLRLHSEFV